MQRTGKFDSAPPHRCPGVPALIALAALGTVLPGVFERASAVPVTSLYVVIVPAADPAQAAQQAMRVELVRLTGRRSAASDPALAALIDNARQYVQLERATTSGQLQVLFDEPALAAAVAATGVTLWDADRPLLWVSLPAMDASSGQAMRTRLTQAAQDRGLPMIIAPAPEAASASAPEPPAAPSAALSPATSPAAASAPAPSAASAASAASPAMGAAPAPAAGLAALNAAHAAGASAALVATFLASEPGALQWTLSAAQGGGQWVGSPELAIDETADTLASAAVTMNRSPVGQYVCHISGVNDLASLVSVLDVMRVAPGVTQVDLSDVSGDQVTLQLGARGTGPQLERALAGSRLQPTGTGAEGLLEYRYVAVR